MAQSQNSHVQTLALHVNGCTRPYEFKFYSDFQGVVLTHFLRENTCYNGIIKIKNAEGVETELAATKRKYMCRRKVILHYEQGLPNLEIFASMNDDLDIITVVLNNTARHEPRIEQVKYEDGKWVQREPAKLFRASVVDLFMTDENGIDQADTFLKFLDAYQPYLLKIMAMSKTEVLSVLGLIN